MKRASILLPSSCAAFNTANSSDTITGALTIGSGGNSTVTVNANGSRNALLNVGSFARTAGGTALFRGQDLGVSPLGAPVNGDANLNFTTPNLVGNGGSGTDRSIFVGVVGDISVTGTGFGATGGILTQDATNGVRRLAGADYKTSIGDGQTDLDNVQLEAIGAPDFSLQATLSGNHLRLTWPSATGYGYQIAVSRDFESWTPQGAPLAGTGGELESRQPLADAPTDRHELTGSISGARYPVTR